MPDFNEKELVFKLDRILKKEFGTNLAFHEFSAGYGIADLVFAPNFSFTKESITRTPITDFGSLSLLLTLSDNKSYYESEIVKLFPQFSQREIKRLLQMLAHGQYLERIGKGEYRKLTLIDPLNPITNIIAVEVKLKDHKKGLVQARRYQYFADESYLAILKEAEKNIDYTEFNNQNIGLILFDSSKNSIEVKHPKPSNTNYQNTVSLFAKEMMMDRFMMNFAS